MRIFVMGRAVVIYLFIALLKDGSFSMTHNEVTVSSSSPKQVDGENGLASTLSRADEIIAVNCPCCPEQCKYSDNNTMLTCENVVNFECCPADCAADIRVLHITSAKFKNVAQARFPPSLQLTHLSIHFSHLTEVEALPSMKQMEHLDISNNSKLNKFKWFKLFNATKLTTLNLSNNGLRVIESDVLTNLKNHSLSSFDMSGNRWDCRDEFDWVLDFQDILQNDEKLTCRDGTKGTDSWLEWNYSILKREKTKLNVKNQCKERTPNCFCDFASTGHQGRDSYTVEVDCSHLGLNRLPDKLPDNTTELNVVGNRLTSLDQVASYSNHLKILIADSNRIHSLQNLSHSGFMRHFFRLSLKNNFIQPHEIPLQQIVDTEMEFEQKYLYLYNNSWECNCQMATTFRDWLWKNRHIVNDSSLLFCSNNGRKTPVLHLLPQAACPHFTEYGELESPDTSLNVLYFVIGLEVLLLLTVLIKFTSDSWRYYRYGELPWIATKLM